MGRRSQLIALLIVAAFAGASTSQAATALDTAVSLPLPEESRTHDSVHSDGSLEVGWQAYRRGNLPEALRAYQDATAAHPTDATLWYDLGCLFALNGEMERARAALERALMLRPRFAKAHDALGQVHEREGNLHAAQAFYASANALEPITGLFLRHLNRTLLHLHEEAAARLVLEELLSVAPEDAKTRYQAGVLALRANEPDRALHEFQHAVERAPSHLLAWNGLAMAYARTGAYDKATQALEQAHALDPENPTTLTNLGVLEARQEHFDEAREAWQNALRIDPSFVPAATNLKALEMLTTPAAP